MYDNLSIKCLVNYIHLCRQYSKKYTLKKVFLTGADGLLGNNLARELVKQNYMVKALFEKGKQPTTFSEMPEIELVYGNILDKAEITDLMKGCQMVIHAAANTNINPARGEMIRKVNIDGTQNIIDAALENNIEKLVFVGTANSFSPGSKTNPGVETNAYTGYTYQTDYMDSKYEAFILVKNAVKEKGLKAITVHPTFMIGPYDTKPSSGAMILAIYNESVPGYTKGGRNYIYVKDVATAAVNGLTMGTVGESYILGNENLNYKEAFSLIAECIGAKPPKIFFPTPITLAYGIISDWIYKLTGKVATVSYPMARISCDEHYYSSAKAVRELNLPLTPIKSVIPEAFNWLKSFHIDKTYGTKK